MPDWWYKREAVVDVINIFQEVTVFGKVVRSNFLFKMSSRGLSEVKKSIVLTKRHSTIYWLWKWYGNPAKTVSPYNNLRQREHIRELLIFSGLHIPLAFQSVWSPSVIPPTRHMVVMPPLRHSARYQGLFCTEIISVPPSRKCTLSRAASTHSGQALRLGRRDPGEDSV